jgi:hypothetical protein
VCAQLCNNFGFFLCLSWMVTRDVRACFNSQLQPSYLENQWKIPPDSIWNSCPWIGMTLISYLAGVMAAKLASPSFAM